MQARRIAWKSEYDIGVPDIDMQHRQLFAMLDGLTRPDQEVRLAEMTLGLGRYIDEHFAYEEDLMRRHGYPRTSEHLAQHRELAAQYRSMTAGVGGSDPQAVARARMVVYAWFTRHILGGTMDRDLGRFLQRIGVLRR